MNSPSLPTRLPHRISRRTWITSGAIAALVAVMALDTKVVVIGSAEDLQEQGFNPESYGEAQFPRIRDSVMERAVDAPALAEAIQADQSAAAAEYGVGEGIGPVVPVRFTGTVGEGKSGVYEVDVADVPEEITIRVQTGPAINGTDLRDATGDIEFGQFTNQIEYQDAGAAINDAMKAEVLTDLDTSDLSGETISVTGVFKLINPKNWFVTPVAMQVE
jgi:predicted lipoprotein